MIEGQTDTTFAIVSIIVAGGTALAAVGATHYVKAKGSLSDAKRNYSDPPTDRERRPLACPKKGNGWATHQP